MSSDVTNSPTSGSMTSTSARSSRSMERSVEHEQLFVFGAAQPVHEHACTSGAGRPLGEQAGQEQLGERCRRHPLDGIDAGLTMDAQTDRDGAGVDPEQGLRSAREGAASEGDTERAGTAVGKLRDPLHAGQIGTATCRG